MATDASLGLLKAGDYTIENLMHVNSKYWVTEYSMAGQFKLKNESQKHFVDPVEWFL